MADRSAHGAFPLGPFALFEPIGRGANGTVWRAVHRASGLPVAIKVLESRRESAALSFRNEIRTVASLEHPHVVRVFDQGTVSPEEAASSSGALTAQRPYLAMELATGGTLEDLKRRPPWPELRELLQCILAALAHAHARGVIHRDLKPNNVLFPGPDDLRPGIKLSDFGIAHAASQAAALEDDPRQHRLSGTLQFMAPEQLAGQYRDEGPWTDLYAVGIMTYQLVGGRPPWADKSRSELLAALLHSVPPVRPRISAPAELQGWLDGLLARRPTERFASAAQAAQALAELSEPEPWGRRSHRPQKHLRRPMFEARVKVPDLPAEPVRPPLRPMGAGLGLFGLRKLPLSGRDRERSLLWEILRSSIEAPSPRVVILRGPSGVGKSRLAEWLSHAAHECVGAVQMRARHSPIPGPTDGLAPMVSALLGCSRLSDEQTLARAQRFISDHPLDHDSPLEAIALAELMRTAPAQAPLSAAARRRTLIRLLERFAPRPAVVWLDDAHWGIDALGFCRALLEVPRPFPVVVLVTLREEELAASSALRGLVRGLEDRAGVSRLTLAPLSLREHHRLVQDLLGLSEELAQRVTEKTLGNPLFAIQLVGDWVRNGALTPTPRGFELTDANTPLSSGLHELWREQLGRLASSTDERNPDAALAVLEVAAALGRSVADNEWRRACSLRGLQVPDELAEALIAHEFAIPTPFGWTFTHTMLRESLERQARRAGRWRGHQRACTEMLAQAALRSDVVAGRRGQHLVEGGELEEAVDALLRGARAARRNSDFDGAHRLLDMRDVVLDQLEAEPGDERRIEGWVARAPCFLTQGKLQAAEALLARASAGPDQPAAPLRAQVELVRGQIDFARGDTEAAVSALQGALDLYDPADSIARIECLTHLGSICMWRRELHLASRYFRQVQEVIGNDPAYGVERGRTLRGLAHVEQCQRNYDQARSLLLAARDCFAVHGHRFEVASCTNDLGELARHQGNVEEAEEYYRSAEAVFETLGAADATVARCNRALTYLQQRHYVDAENLFRRLLDEALAEPRQVDELWIRGGLLACSAAARDWQEWDRHAEQVEKLLGGGFVDEDLGMVTRLAGELARTAGETRRARLALRLSLQLHEKMQDHRNAAELATALEEL